MCNVRIGHEEIAIPKPCYTAPELGAAVDGAILAYRITISDLHARGLSAIAEMLGRVADTYDRLVDNSVERLMALLPPLLLIVVGILVVLIILSTLLLIF